MSNQLYPSDLTEREWECIRKHIPPARAGGRPRSTEMREVLNAIFYVPRGGISWRMLLRDFPNWKTFYHYFRQWRITGLWKKIHDRLRALCRKKARRNRQPSAAIIDSQEREVRRHGWPGARL